MRIAHGWQMAGSIAISGLFVPQNIATLQETRSKYKYGGLALQQSKQSPISSQINDRCADALDDGLNPKLDFLTWHDFVILKDFLDEDLHFVDAD